MRKIYTRPQAEVITIDLESSLLLPIGSEGGGVGDGKQWARRRNYYEDDLEDDYESNFKADFEDKEL